MAFPTIPPDVMQFITGVLSDMGVPVTNVAIEGFATWLANEQGGDWSAFENNKGNPLGIQTAAAQAAGKSGDMAAGIKQTAALLKTAPYAGVASALKNATSVDDIATAVMASDWSGVNRPGKPNVYTSKGLAAFLAAPTGGAGAGTTQGEVGTVNIPGAANPTPTVTGAGIKNFHGYDLSAFTSPAELANAEQLIEKYVSDPTFKTQLDNKLKTEYGYSSDWWQNIPQLNAVMIYAGNYLDPSAAAAKNTFDGLVHNTSWWGQTNANQRAWEQAYGANGSEGSDPATAAQELQNAQELVLADANQIGVQLTKQELDSIAMMYARNNYEQPGTFGSGSGTAHEWLDQAIINTIENIKGVKQGGLPTDFSTDTAGTSDFSQINAAAGTQAPQGFAAGGIASQLYTIAQNMAQQYLLYDPNNPEKGLVNNAFLMQQVGQALQGYTGSGSSFGSSNLINGFQAAFTQTLMNMAKQFYPSLSSSIDAGITPQNYVKPYQTLIQDTLGYNGNVNFLDPQWSWILGTPDPKTGIKTALTPDQVQQKLVTLPAWQTSNNAAALGDTIATGLNKQFGFGGD